MVSARVSSFAYPRQQDESGARIAPVNGLTRRDPLSI